MKWRRLNNVLHRDVGYLAVGLTLIYGISGLAVNHTADWNPSYARTKTTQTIAPIQAADKETIVREALSKLQLTEAPRNSFRPDPETVRLFFKDRTYSVDLPTGAVIVETVRPRPVLFEMNQLHLNTPKRVWTYLADVYAVSIIFLAISGMFVLKGRLGITGRGAWMTSIGVFVPVSYWVYHLYLE